MKKNTFLLFQLALCWLTIAVISRQASAQERKSLPGFIAEPFTPAFIFNKGQFDQYSKVSSSIIYSSQLGNTLVLFHENSIEFVQNTCINSEGDYEGEERENEREVKREFNTTSQSLNFLNANPHPEFIAAQPVSQYFTYPDPEVKNGTIISNGWNEISIKNIYDGIDVTFSYEQKGGLKYSFTVFPGADASKIKMKWDGVERITVDDSGNLYMNSGIGIIRDKAPRSFYADAEKQYVASSFSVNENVVSISLSSYDHGRTLIIDPWITNPGFITLNSAYDIRRDQAGDIYVYGGATPYQLQKYNSLGAPLWTYNTSAQGYYGDFTLDPSGYAYCIYGPWTNQCVKLTPGGSVVWTSINPAHAGYVETYRVCFNPQTGLLVVVGMELLTGFNPMAETIDTLTGTYSPYTLHPISINGETRSLSVDGNGDIYSLIFSAGTPWPQYNEVWKMDAAMVTTGSVNSGYLLGELEPSNTDTWYSGYNGIEVGPYALFTYDGETVKKWDKNTLAIIDSVSIPGGQHYMTAGLCTDSCGNVYVGGPTSILEFDSTLTLVTSVATPGRVHDVSPGNLPGEILGCGVDFLGSFDFPVCASGPPIAIFTAPNDICPGTCTDFINLSSGGLTFQWLFPGANPSVSTDVSPTNICYNTPGNYTVTLIATNAVGSDTLTLNNFVSVYPYPPPQGIQQIGDSLIANPGAVSYQWYQDGNLIPGATDYFYIATGSGNFNVVATDANGCEVEAAIFDVVAGLLESTLRDEDIFIYPNPAGDQLTIKSLQAEVKSLSIYNVIGEKVIDLISSSAVNSRLFHLDVTSLTPGIYLIEMMVADRTIRTKFVKQ